MNIGSWGNEHRCIFGGLFRTRILGRAKRHEWYLFLPQMTQMTRIKLISFYEHALELCSLRLRRMTRMTRIFLDDSLAKTALFENKNKKYPTHDVCGRRPNVLSSSLVPKSELLHWPEAQYGFVPKNSHHSGKNPPFGLKTNYRISTCMTRDRYWSVTQISLISRIIRRNHKGSTPVGVTKEGFSEITS